VGPNLGPTKDSAGQSRRFRQRLTPAARSMRLCDGSMVFQPNTEKAARFVQGAEALARCCDVLIAKRRASPPKRSDLPENAPSLTDAKSKGHRLVARGAKAMPSSPTNTPSPAPGLAAHIIWSAVPIRQPLVHPLTRVAGGKLHRHLGAEIPLTASAGYHRSFKPFCKIQAGASCGCNSIRARGLWGLSAAARLAEGWTTSEIDALPMVAEAVGSRHRGWL